MRLGSLVLLTASVVLSALPALAHHSFAAQFDDTKPVKMTGTVTKVEWSNPHIWFYIDVKDKDGNVTNWGFSGGPPGVMMRRGITRNSIKIGDVVVVDGFRAKDGSNNASSGTVTFTDGRKVFTAAAEDAVPSESK
jgi:hypothetical protein